MSGIGAVLADSSVGGDRCMAAAAALSGGLFVLKIDDYRDAIRSGTMFTRFTNS
jgi:hypothetical protein